MSAGEGGLHTRYGQVFYGVTYLDQRFLGAEKGSTCEQDTCSRRVDLAYPFGCLPLPSTAFYPSSTMLRFAPYASIVPSKQTK